MKELDFYWKLGGYVIRSVPKHLDSIKGDNPNETIELVLIFQSGETEIKLPLAYFEFNKNDEQWKLRFVGSWFTTIPDEYVLPIFKMLKGAYDVLEEWTKERENNDHELT